MTDDRKSLPTAEVVELREALEDINDAVHSHVDGRDLLDELCPSGWHYCDILVRINGQDKRYEGDWLKRLWYATRRHKAALHPTPTAPKE